MDLKSFIVFFYLPFLIIQTQSNPHLQSLDNKHFVLIHGSGHGAWSWYKVVTLLKSSGHNVTTLDLAASGIDPTQVNSLQTISEYFKPLTDLMMALPLHERVILVGHSLGGLAISQAMERFPRKIAVAVFVSASMPGPALNVSVLNQETFKTTPPSLDNRNAYDNGPNNPPTTFIFGPLFLKTNVYQLSPTEDLTLATMLLRPLRLFSDEDMSKALVLSSDRYGSVNRVFIVSEEDRLVNKELLNWVFERNPPDEVLKIKGSDHMVMMSKPLELWTHLQRIVEKYN